MARRVARIDPGSQPGQHPPERSVQGRQCEFAARQRLPHGGLFGIVLGAALRRVVGKGCRTHPALSLIHI